MIRGKDIVYNAYSEPVSFEAAMNIADDDLREELHAAFGGFVSNQEFFDLYADAHRKKFGEVFAPYVGDAY